MKYGPIVAERFKKQYFHKGKWDTLEEWEIQPEKIYLILQELSTKQAIEAFIDKSWTRRLPKEKK